MCGGEIAGKRDPNPAGEGRLTGRFVPDSTFCRRTFAAETAAAFVSRRIMSRLPPFLEVIKF